MSYISECKLQHTDYSLMTFLLKLQLGLFDCREMCALNRSSRGRVVGLAELSIQFNNNRPLLFKLDGVSCFASLKLARQIIGADCVLLFFKSNLNNLVLKQNALFKSLNSSFKLALSRLPVEFEFRALAVEGDLQLAVDVAVELNDVKLGVFPLEALQVDQLLLDVVVDAQVAGHVLGH